MQNIEKLHVTPLMKKRFINYAMSVITDRALPDVRDGLKPVHRRILWAMYEAGNFASKGYKKSARMVGDVIGKYHPHGDSSVYGAAARMTQPFSFNTPLIDGQGNFGSIDGDNPAAMRYTEMRLSKLSQEFFGSIRKDTVNWRSNYDESEKEPESLPVPFPSILAINVTGIAVGMASSLLPHNLSDVIDCTIATLEKEERLTIKEAMDILKAPDFPTGAIVYDLDGFANAIETGRGTVKVRSKWHEEERRSGTTLVIDEIPYMVNKASLVASIADMVSNRELEDVVGLRDESNKEGIRIAIDIKKGGSAEVVFSQLALKTQVEVSMSYNCMVIDGGRPKLMGLLDMIYAWNAYRKETVLRKYIFERKEAMAKLHILEGLLKALNMLDETINAIRESKDAAEAKSVLCAFLEIDDIQAQAILDMRLQKLTGLEIDSIKEDHQKITDLVNLLTFKIETPAEIVKDIIEELRDIQKRFGEPRRTEIGHGFSSLTREDLVVKEDVLVTLSESGYIKRMPINAIDAQKRGTKGKRAMQTSDNDNVKSIYQVNTHDLLMVFGESGQVYATKAYNIPEQKPTDRGRHIKNIIEGFDEEVNAVLALPMDDEQSTVVTITQKGQVKRSPVSVYAGATRKGGILGVGLNEGDELVNSFTCKPEDHIMLVSSSGRAVRFTVEQVSTVGRTATGVRGIKLDEGEQVVGAHIIESGNDDGQFILCISENGLGKKTPISEFDPKGRAGKGMIAYKESAKSGKLVKALGVTNDDDLVIFTSTGVANKVHVSDLQTSGRATSGSKIISLSDGQSIISVVTSPKSEEDNLGDEED
jgi:DNA gyrase subunit A